MAQAYDINTRTPDQPTEYFYAANAHRAETYLIRFIRAAFPEMRATDAEKLLTRVKDAGLAGVTVSRPNGLYFLSADKI